LEDKRLMMVSITASNHQRKQAVNRQALVARLNDALPFLQPLPVDFPDEIAIRLVSDREIAKAHGEFLNDPTPTDVITFQHGDVLISVETAAREAVSRGITLDEELLRYGLHAMLHLCGEDDHEPEARRRMQRRQERLVRKVLRAS